MKEAAFLMPVQRVVGGIEVEHDLPRRFAMGIEEEIYEQILDGTLVDRNLVVPVNVLARRVFQAVQRALSTESRAVRTARLQTIREQRQHRIKAQGIVIVHVLIAQRQADNPLADQRFERMHYSPRIAPVPKARPNPIDQANRSIHLPQQQRPSIRRHCAAVKRRLDPTAVKTFERKLFRDTLCLHRTPL
jgi:hypothetical protein